MNGTNEKRQEENISMEELAGLFAGLRREIGKVVIGQEEIIDQMLIGFFASGHLLITGVPGLAKTLVIKTLSRSLAMNFNRVQFVPDLMPSDIIGSEVIRDNLKEGTKEFVFRPGPIFTNIFMADEINRASPKTQSALLESMQEHRVSIGGNTYEVGSPFAVFATQNPLEFEGTYPLPEAQLDRFLMSILISYPDKADEVAIATAKGFEGLGACKTVMGGSEVLAIQSAVKEIPVATHLVEKTVDLVRKSRPDNPESPKEIRQYLKWGAGPRAAQALIKAAKASALIDGRFNVSEEDISKCLLPVMRHRIILNYKADADKVSPDDILALLVK
jgi:MoxR-like ATPase